LRKGKEVLVEKPTVICRLAPFKGKRTRLAWLAADDYVGSLYLTYLNLPNVAVVVVDRGTIRPFTRKQKFPLHIHPEPVGILPLSKASPFTKPLFPHPCGWLTLVKTRGA
jgi:hypothetical protein